MSAVPPDNGHSSRRRHVWSVPIAVIKAKPRPAPIPSVTLSRVDKFRVGMQSLGMIFRNTIEPFSETAAYRCPCCLCRTLRERGGYEVCPACFWEDDGQDDHDADEVRGGPNGSLSLTRARQNFKQYGASDPAHRTHVRPPTEVER